MTFAASAFLKIAPSALESKTHPQRYRFTSNCIQSCTGLSAEEWIANAVQ